MVISYKSINNDLLAVEEYEELIPCRVVVPQKLADKILRLVQHKQ